MGIDNKPEERYTSRSEREEIGRRTNAGFARVERVEVDEGANDLPTGAVGEKLSEEEIRRRVGEGNFETAKDDRQSNSINS
ncbi:hypothetical protein [Planococcus maitriensis]|uniref:Uncharacterized protein n=1 Tax=Planococcus maitriensis TaxID=221799 RepID=A0A365K763_9BACL|nr:hypothetical protein [Planococcus maitriensis]RAZ68340.1 hypothetical protein DP119_06645 [Planococcus maitriensis]